MNEHRTSDNSGTGLTQPGSRPVRYRLISPDDKKCGSYRDIERAVRAGKKKWPDVLCGDREEDPGAWDVWAPEAKSAVAAS